MKRILSALIFIVCMIFPAAVYAQTSGNTPPPPPYCTSANAGALYTNTGTSPATVYTCSYYNLMWQWVVNPSYGGLVSYPTVPTTCSGSLPVFLAGWPNTQMYVCVSGVPVSIGGYGSGVTNFSAPSGSWPSWLVPTVTNPTTTPSLTVAASTVPLSGGGTGATTAAGALANLGGVPTSTTVNGHALSSNVTISASDLTTGTLPHAQLPTLLSGDIPNNGANTTGTAANLSGTPALPNGTTATTQSTSDTSTDVATDAFVHNVATASVPSSTAGTTAGYNATGSALGPSPQALYVPNIPNDNSTDAAVIGNAGIVAGQQLVIPTTAQGGKNCAALTSGPLLVAQDGAVISGGGWGAPQVNGSCIDNKTGGTAIFVSAYNPLAELAGSATCTTAPILSLNLAGTALSGTVIIVEPGAGCNGIDGRWIIVGNGTPGTATVNATYTSGSVTAATVTPGTSTGYTPSSGTKGTYIHDLNIVGFGQGGNCITFVGYLPGQPDYSDVNYIDRVYCNGHIGGIKGYGTGNTFAGFVELQNTDPNQSFNFAGGVPNSAVCFKCLVDGYTNNGNGAIAFLGDSNSNTTGPTIKNNSNGFFVLMDNESNSQPKYLGGPNSTAVLIASPAINSLNSTGPLNIVGNGAALTSFSPPDQSILASDYPIFTVAASTAAGTLAAGTYCYSMYGINPTGHTTASPPQCAVLSSAGEINATVTVHPGYQTLGVCGRTSGSQLVMTFSPVIQGNATTWTDNNSITPSGACPSTSTLYYPPYSTTDIYGDILAYTQVYRGSGANNMRMMGSMYNGEFYAVSDHMPVYPDNGIPTATAYTRGTIGKVIARQSSTAGDGLLFSMENASKTFEERDLANNVESNAGLTTTSTYYLNGTTTNTTSNTPLYSLGNFIIQNSNYAPALTIGVQNETGTGSVLNLKGGSTGGGAINLFGDGASPGSSQISVDAATGLTLQLGSTNAYVTTAGAMTAASFSGPLTGNVTGNVTGTANAVNLAVSGSGGVTGVLPSANMAAATSSAAGAVIQIANTTFTVSSSTTIANGACSPAAASAATQVAMTNVTTGMTFDVTATTDTANVTGWGAPGAGVLYITDYPTAGYFNYHVCNNSGASITTDGSVTFNVSAR